MDAGVQQYLEALPPAKRKLATQVHALVRKSFPEITACIKWRHICYYRGKDMLVHFYHFPKTDYMNFGYTHALEFPNPSNLLEGSGKKMRHIKLFPDDQIPGDLLCDGIRQSLEVVKKK